METPVYIKIDEYRDVLDTVELLKKKISEGKKMLEKINELKNEEDAELERWSAELEELERKMGLIDRTLYSM